MSGPKVDHLELEYRRQQELQALMAARQAQARMVSGTLGDIRSKVSTAKAACSGLGERGRQLVEQLSDLEGQLCRRATSASSGKDASTSVAQRALNESLASTLSDIAAEAERSVRTVVDRADELRRRDAVAREVDRHLAELEDFAGRMSNAAPLDEGVLDQEVIARLFRAAAKPRSASRPPQPSHEVAEDARAEALEMLASIQALLLSDAVDTTRKDHLSAAAVGIREALLAGTSDTQPRQSLETAVTIGRYVVRDAQGHAELMESLYADCLAQQALVESLGGHPDPLPELWELSDEHELDARLHELRDLADQVATDALIAQALDTVMARHGYTIAKSVCLTDAPDARQRFFMAEGTDVGVHAYMGPNGTLMLETAAIGRQIRTAEDGVEVRRVRATTAYDRARLLESQREFCEQHRQFVAELAELGVVMHVRSDMAPSEDHAYLFEPAQAIEATSSAQAVVDERFLPGRPAEREMS